MGFGPTPPSSAFRPELVLPSERGAESVIRKIVGVRGFPGMAVSLTPSDGSNDLAVRSPATTRPLMLLELVGDVLALCEDTLWAVDINHGGAALFIGLLVGHDQPMVCLVGLAVHHRVQGKTDAKGAFTAILGSARLVVGLHRFRIRNGHCCRTRPAELSGPGCAAMRGRDRCRGVGARPCARESAAS